MNVEDVVREGIVTAVDNGRLIAKVYFDYLGIESDWMPVLFNKAVIKDYPYDSPQWTEFETECKPESGRVGDKDYVDHRHKLVINPWMPKVGDLVLVLYFPLHSADGVVLGKVTPWR